MKVDDLSGQQLGNYRLISILGTGGYATVYLGMHLILQREAAIKVLKEIVLNEEDQVGFHMEARLISRLVHPNIIKVLEAGIEMQKSHEDGSIPYLVMDYAQHGSLRKRHPRGTTVAFKQIASYVEQLASALHYAHEQKVLHLDVKPENVLVMSSGNILLSDFGIAVTGHDEEKPFSMDGKERTVAYIAPERLDGLSRPGRASDQYSLAIVVYEWLTGHCPFEGTQSQVIYQHLHVTPAPLYETNSLVIQEINNVVMRALAKNPKQRYPTVIEFARALNTAVQLVSQPHSQKLGQQVHLERSQQTNNVNQQQGPIEIFCCYAREDQHFLEELKMHLRPLQHQGFMSLWSDTDISPGTNYEKEISKHLYSAQIILLLISPSFIASDYCYSKEMQQAIERHQQGEARVIPIIVRYSLWKEIFLISELQALPTDARPISSWLDPDKAFLEVVMGIKKVAEDITIQSALTQEKKPRTSSQSKSKEMNFGNTYVPKFSSRNSIAWCPSCANEFFVGDCRIMSGLTPGKELKPAPQQAELHLARRKAESLIRPTYLRESASRECPFCLRLLPYNIELAENKCIAIVGDTYSGKSHYLASVIYQLKERWQRENRKSISLTCLTPDVERFYYQEYVAPVFLGKQQLHGTLPALPGNHFTPLIYELKFTKSSEYPVRRVNIILYDGSGEDYAHEARLARYARHIMYADAIIFLIDPTSVSQIYKRLPQHLQSSDNTGRPPSSVINSTIQLLERFHDVEARDRFSSIPVAIMLSKADLFNHTAPIGSSYRFMSHSISGDHLDLEDIKAVDKEVRSVLEKYKQRAVLRASQKFPNVSFFATSATGCAPGRDSTFPFIAPFRCMDPVLWIFQQFNIVKNTIS